jgi:hypothetical protein
MYFSDPLCFVLNSFSRFYVHLSRVDAFNNGITLKLQIAIHCCFNVFAFFSLEEKYVQRVLEFWLLFGECQVSKYLSNLQVIWDRRRLTIRMEVLGEVVNTRGRTKI